MRVTKIARDLSIIVFIFLISTNCSQQKQNYINLKGQWKFAVDPSDTGISDKLYNSSFSDNIKLPGSMRDNGKGQEPTLQTNWTGSIYDSSFYFAPGMEQYRQPGNIKFPFWLTPNKHYVGPAWYQKIVNIPSQWDKKRIVLHLERPHWETRVWIDSTKIGMQNSLSTPHEYDLTNYLTSGKHKITIRVDNRIKDINVGPDSHSLTDHTQGNWNGIVGDLKLLAKSKVFFDNIKIFPDVENRSAKVKLWIQNSIGKINKGRIKLDVKTLNGEEDNRFAPIQKQYTLSSQDTTIEMNYQFGENIELWDEFDPNLYKLEATLHNQSKTLDKQSIQFGMRDFSTKGTRFTINGRETFLRGTVECCVFPLTGYPPTEVSEWKRIFRICKKYGLNHMRFHSWCPPEAAFDAADQLGIYLQPEAPCWANHGTSLGDGDPIDKYIYKETKKIIDEYGNHPSFVMMGVGGNEPAGRNQVKYLNELVTYWKEKDNRRLYTGASIGSSWPIVPKSEFIVRSEPRGLPWNKKPQTLFDHHKKIEDVKVPYVAHESGQYNVYPNFKEMDKYTGVYKPKNFELFQQELEEHHMGRQAHEFLMASGKLQALAYKHEIEAALRTPGFAGFQLLSLNDFPGQGTALVGLLDAFWEEKGYINSPEFTKFCGPTIPLARFPKFVFYNTETLNVTFEISHFGEKPLKNIVPEYSIISNSGEKIKQEKLKEQNIPIGNTISLGKLNIPLSFVNKAGKYKLKIKVGKNINSWNFWVYPEKSPKVDMNDIYVTDNLNKQAEKILNQGGKVFLHAADKVENGKRVKQYFRPVFWNTSWFQMRPPHTLGILCENDHPAFKYFPTEYHSDLQWWSILNRQQVMRLNNFPPEFKPLLQPIDTYHLNRRLGAILEARVNSGKILVSSSDLQHNLENRPAARQLYYSLKKYMNSREFNPEYSVDLSVIQELFVEKDRDYINFYTKESTDDLKPEKEE